MDLPETITGGEEEGTLDGRFDGVADNEFDFNIELGSIVSTDALKGTKVGSMDGAWGLSYGMLDGPVK